MNSVIPHCKNIGMCAILQNLLMTKQTEKCLDTYYTHDQAKLLTTEQNLTEQNVPGHLSAQSLNFILTSVVLCFFFCKACCYY